MNVIAQHSCRYRASGTRNELAVTTRSSIEAYHSNLFVATFSSRIISVMNAATSSTSSRMRAPPAPSQAIVQASSGSRTVAAGDVGKFHSCCSGRATW